MRVDLKHSNRHSLHQINDSQDSGWFMMVLVHYILDSWLQHVAALTSQCLILSSESPQPLKIPELPRSPIAVANEVQLSGYHKSPTQIHLHAFSFMAVKDGCIRRNSARTLNCNNPGLERAKRKNDKACWKNYKYQLLFHACHSDDVVACPSMELTLWLM